MGIEAEDKAELVEEVLRQREALQCRTSTIGLRRHRRSSSEQPGEDRRGGVRMLRLASSFAPAARMWPQALVGGLDRHGALLTGTPDEVEREVRAAVAAVGGRHAMISAGCALPLARPDANLDAARRAVRA